MNNGHLRQFAIFITGSVLCGVLVALLLIRLWPGLVRAPAAAPAPAPQTTQTALNSPQETVAPSSDGDPDADPAARPVGTDGTGLLAQSDSGSFAPAVRLSAPAVVSIYTRRVERPVLGIEQLLGAPVRPQYRDGLGSGVIVDADGHIVTNQHVIQNSEAIRVRLADGREAPAIVVGSDPDTDIAVLKVNLPELPVMQFGRSDRVAVGDVVLAIGNPLGLSQTVTAGIVSATGRAELGVSTFEDFIQTDAAINHGNSGGALVNTRGELIGINTAVLGRNLDAEGIGVAIPVDMVRGVLREILTHGRVTRGWLGLVLEDVPEEYARYEGLAHGGVVISNFYRGSPALLAGLSHGDVIETFEGSPVRSARDTLARVASRKPGDTVELTGMRGQQRFTVKLKVAETPRR
jgi:serine protease DegS